MLDKKFGSDVKRKRPGIKWKNSSKVKRKKIQEKLKNSKIMEECSNDIG